MLKKSFSYLFLVYESISVLIGFVFGFALVGTHYFSWHDLWLLPLIIIHHVFSIWYINRVYKTPCDNRILKNFTHFLLVILFFSSLSLLFYTYLGIRIAVEAFSSQRDFLFIHAIATLVFTLSALACRAVKTIIAVHKYNVRILHKGRNQENSSIK